MFVEQESVYLIIDSIQKAYIPSYEKCWIHYKDYSETFSKTMGSNETMVINVSLNIEYILIFGVYKDRQRFSEERVTRKKLLYIFVRGFIH